MPHLPAGCGTHAVDAVQPEMKDVAGIRIRGIELDSCTVPCSEESVYRDQPAGSARTY